MCGAPSHLETATSVRNRIHFDGVDMAVFLGHHGGGQQVAGRNGCGPFSTIRTHIAPAALHVYFPLVHTPGCLSPRDNGVTEPG
jgi:hypothetical protein